MLAFSRPRLRFMPKTRLRKHACIALFRKLLGTSKLRKRVEVVNIGRNSEILLKVLKILWKFWNLVDFQKFGWISEVWSKLSNLVENLKFGQNFKIWLISWNLVEILKFGKIFVIWMTYKFYVMTYKFWVMTYNLQLLYHPYNLIISIDPYNF